MDAQNDLLLYAHIGDLHLTTADQDNYRDFQRIVSEIGTELAGFIDFVYVPGDNADNGFALQYELVRRELSRLPIPVHVITGDHDMEPGHLHHFYDVLGASKLPKQVEAGGIRCLFLDMCGPGTGGPDFHIGSEQRAWLAKELDRAKADNKRCAIFMHTYPDDLKREGETSAINEAFADGNVLLVDMGHTHYNELANDGRTIFASTRSTGQIEEGPVGYALVAIDRRTVSWRFKELGSRFPLVMITAPADRRLAADATDPDHFPLERCEIRASVLGRHPIEECRVRIDGGSATVMREVSRGRYAISTSLAKGSRHVRVDAEDALGSIGTETIEIASPTDPIVERYADGSDRDAIGAWPERGIPGGQLGPNRNGRKW